MQGEILYFPWQDSGRSIWKEGEREKGGRKARTKKGRKGSREMNGTGRQGGREERKKKNKRGKKGNSVSTVVSHAFHSNVPSSQA